MINRYFNVFILSLTMVTLLGFGYRSQAQVVTSVPIFPTMDDSLTLTFDATQGDGGLATLTGAVYGHFGLIVTGPTGTTWTRVPGTFTDTDPRKLLTSIGNRKYTIRFVPRNLFGNVPANIIGYRIGMVFRNAAGTQTGKNADGSDIFLNLYQPGQTAMRFITPGDRVSLVTLGTNVPLSATASVSGNLIMTMDGATVATNSGTTIDFNYTAATGSHLFKVGISGVAGVDYYDSVTVVVRGNPRIQALPAGWKVGPNYLSGTSVGLVIAAPQKNFGYVMGDFNNWLKFDTALFMNQTPDGHYLWLQLDNLTAGTEYAYQFFLDGNVTTGDPLAEKVLDPNNDRTINALIYPNLKPYPTGKTTGIVSTITPGATPYVWRHARPAPPEKRKLFVYELHLRDFLGRAQDKGFQGLIDTIGYLQKLGVTAIELMPVSEFEGNNSWGYNPNYHGAIDKAYGPADKLKALVDTCHGLGIIVILDVVYNHAFGSSPLVQMYPAATSPYVNAVARHPFNVGTDLNHESIFTREFVVRCNQRLLDDYQIDGFRFDLSKGLTQRNSGNDVGAWGNYDASRIAILNHYGDAIRQSYPLATVILEHFAVTQEEKELTEDGFFVWGGMHGAYRDAAKGIAVSSSLSGTYFLNRGLTVPNAVVYMESHDEERLIYDVLTTGRQSLPAYNTRDSITAYDRMKLAAVFFFPIPGPKMIWQFGELGYPYSINACANGIPANCRVDPKPVRWSYPRNPYRQGIYKVYQALMQLVKTEPVFTSTPTQLQLNGSIRRIALAHPSGNVLVLGNFAIAPITTTTGLAPGKWYEFFTGDSVTSVATTDPLILQAGEYRIYSQKKFYNPGPGLTLGVEDEFHLPLSLAFPNPTTGKLTVTTRTEAQLMDLQGRLLQTAKPLQGEAHLDLTGMAPGLYLVRAQGRVQRVVKR